MDTGDVSATPRDEQMEECGGGCSHLKRAMHKARQCSDDGEVRAECRDAIITPSPFHSTTALSTTTRQHTVLPSNQMINWQRSAVALMPTHGVSTYVWCVW